MIHQKPTLPKEFEEFSMEKFGSQKITDFINTINRKFNIQPPDCAEFENKKGVKGSKKLRDYFKETGKTEIYIIIPQVCS